ncbi:MAG: haloacid dehalogenase type II [Geminicoccaceae bacterium]
MTHVTLAFDVYGTLVDPQGLVGELEHDAGRKAIAVSALWREKQVEYAFRRGLMGAYVPFDLCTAHALEFACRTHSIALDQSRRAHLLAAYRKLPAFTDAKPALEILRDAGHRLYAFSNGPTADIDAVLGHAELHRFFIGIVSADEVRRFKPDPALYAHARRATGAGSGPIWLVSGNIWDALGARGAGWDAAWVRRSADKLQDPWEIEPTVTIGDLTEMAGHLGQRT